MKTLTAYRQEFSELNDYNKIFEKLAYHCISDYPDEELGYEELGYFLFSQVDMESTELPTEFFKILEKIKSDFRFGITLGRFLLEWIEIEREEWVMGWKLDSIDLQETKYFKNVWLVLGRYKAAICEFSDASKFINKAKELGADLNIINRWKDINIYGHISSIIIRKFLSIKEVELINLETKKEIYFLGENGVGKTVFLQSIIFSVNQRNANEIILSHYNFFPNVEIAPSKTSNIVNYLYSHPSIFAYGISRFRSSSKEIDEYGYATLFGHDTYLTSPQEWLKDVQRREFLGKSSISLKSVMEMLADIINFEGDVFKIEYDNKKDEFVFIEKGTPTKFEHLADGYRSVLVWMCDLIYRLSKVQPFTTNIKDFEGVVLVDEIDMLLHPKWEYTIVSKLREKLPKIQWFFTTHSPILILGASDDAVFYKVYKENGETKISEQMACKDFDNLLANAVITSSLFDLDTARMRSFATSEKELDTSRTFMESRLALKVREKLANAKSVKSFVSPSEIDAEIDKAIQELFENEEDDTNS